MKLTVLGKSYTAPLEITADPRLTVTQADLTKQFDLLLKIRDAVTQTDDTIIQIRSLREQIDAVNKHVGNDTQSKAIVDAGKALNKKMTDVEEVLIQTKAKSGQDVLNFPVRSEQSPGRAGRRSWQRGNCPDATVLRSVRHAQQAVERAVGQMEGDRLDRHSGLQQSRKTAGGSRAQGDTT